VPCTSTWFYLDQYQFISDTSAKLVYDTLLSDMGTLKPLAKPKNANGNDSGFAHLGTAIEHHLHCIVPSGGINRDGGKHEPMVNSCSQ
jgi:hypothetical protein